MTNHFIAWWNLENLIDVEDALLDRPEWLVKAGSIEVIV